MSTQAERYQRGRALRRACPRERHADWTPRSSEIDPVERIQSANADLVAGLLPIRYGRMAASPFAFFRGTAALQAIDLASAAASGITVQLCGDCHVANFGGFATPERNLVFDVNDFDETFPGPWEWDLKRLTTSLILAARHRELSARVAREIAIAAGSSYRERMAGYAHRPILEVWYDRIEYEDLPRSLQGNSGPPQSGFKGTRSGGATKIVDQPPFVYHFERSEERWRDVMHAFVRRYRGTLLSDRRKLLEHFTFQDIAAKIVGIGSVGTHCAVALFSSDDDDWLFLQLKQARQSVLQPPGSRSPFVHQGERVVEGQRLMQGASDIFLGWAELPGSQDYYVRQLHDMKVSLTIDQFGRRRLREYAAACGMALARAHAKAGDAPTIAGYIGRSETFVHALASYAASYADQVERDYDAFKRAIASGRVRAETAGEASPVDFEP